jgi:hypothetical protein
MRGIGELWWRLWLAWVKIPLSKIRVWVLVEETIIATKVATHAVVVYVVVCHLQLFLETKTLFSFLLFVYFCRIFLFECLLTVLK